MKRWWQLLLVAAFAVGPVHSKDEASSSVIGVYYAKEKTSLAPIFMNSVTTWLRRYEPRLVERGIEHVRMQVKYDFLYDVELAVKEGEFEVRVTLAQKTERARKAREQAAKLASGVLKKMSGLMARERRNNERWGVQ